MRLNSSLAAPLLVLLLGGVAGCASDSGISTMAPKAKTADAEALPTDVDSGVRQAQSLRQAGRYDDAVHMLSQLMLVASDDPRVISEYGKTLAEKGRAQDAVQFLSRAVEMQPTDWTSYSALGVAYDQLGNQADARTAYEHALALKPGEPSVLSNYALSRMLAHDPDTARQLMTRVEIAGGAKDPKIARNMALVNQLAGEAPQAPTGLAYAVNKPAPTAPIAVPSRALANNAPAPAAMTPVQSRPMPPVNRVVMQAVPFDPLAGPVKTAMHEPRALTSHIAAHIAAKAEAPAKEDVAKAEPKTDAKADAKVDAKDARPFVAAPVRAPVKAAENKAEQKDADKITLLKPAEAKLILKNSGQPDAKGVAIAGPPVVLKAPEKKTDEKKADAKADAKPDAKKDAVPALRVTAQAY